MKKEKHDKFKPILEKKYIVTDQCFWKSLNKKEVDNYNPYDKTRAPHSIQLIDIETGTIVNLHSGSVIKIVKSK